MSLSERRRRGNALREDPGDPPRRGNTPTGQRGSRHLAGSRPPPDRAQNRVNPGSRRERVEPRSKPHQPGADARQRLSFGCCGKAPRGQAKAANRTREIRPSGMKTGGLGNVAMGAGLRSVGESRGDTTGPYSARARDLSRPDRDCGHDPGIHNPATEICHGRATEQGAAVIAVIGVDSRTDAVLTSTSVPCRKYLA
jgi:hypothetical protein